MAKLCRVQTPQGISAVHVDFPEGCERSREGSLYVRPNTVLEVTEAEAAYLADSQPWGKRLHRLPDLPAKAKSASGPPKTTITPPAPKESKSDKKPESKAKAKDKGKSKPSGDK